MNTIRDLAAMEPWQFLVVVLSPLSVVALSAAFFFG